jgi:hypothetical protein
MKKLVKKQSGGISYKKKVSVDTPVKTSPDYIKERLTEIAGRMKPYPKQEIKFNPSNVSKNGLILKKPITDSIYKPLKKGGATKAKKK